MWCLSAAGVTLKDCLGQVEIVEELLWINKLSAKTRKAAFTVSKNCVIIKKIL